MAFERTKTQQRLDNLRKDLNRKLRQLNKDIDLHIEQGMDPLDMLNEELDKTRGEVSDTQYRFRIAEVRQEKLHKKQELTAQKEFIEQLEKLRQKIYNKKRSKRWQNRRNSIGNPFNFRN